LFSAGERAGTRLPNLLPAAHLLALIRPATFIGNPLWGFHLFLNPGFLPDSCRAFPRGWLLRTRSLVEGLILIRQAHRRSHGALAVIVQATAPAVTANLSGCFLRGRQANGCCHLLQAAINPRHIGSPARVTGVAGTRRRCAVVMLPGPQKLLLPLQIVCRSLLAVRGNIFITMC